MVDDGYGIVRGGVDAVEHVGVSLRVGHLVEVVMGVLEQLHEVGGCSGLEPESPNSILAKVFNRLNGLYIPSDLAVKWYPS